jgi:zinc protease
MLYKELVENRKTAQSVDVTATFPNGRLGSLFVFTVVPAEGHTVEENEQVLNALLTRLMVQPPDTTSLERAKNQLRARVVRLLGTDSALAFLLTRYYVTFGDWRKLFDIPANYAHVTAEDVQRVTAQYFVPQNRTVVYLTGQRQMSTSGGAR